MIIMPSGTHPADLDFKVIHPLPSDTAVTTVIKSVSLAVIITGGLLENVCVIATIIKEKKLHRSPYYYMINLSVADLLRTSICLPFVMVTVLHGSQWHFGSAGCSSLAFFNTFLMFGSLFAVLILALDRHLAIIHQQFHSRKLNGLISLGIILIGWGFAFLLAFPPVFGLGTYTYIPMEAQCVLEHRYYRDNDTFGFTLIFTSIVFLTLFVYFRIFKFLRAHRKMRPIMYQPARSDNWTFYAPGANAVGAGNNLLNGFARIITTPLTMGHHTFPHASGNLMDRNMPSSNERFTNVFVLVTLVYDTSWLPYIIMTYWYTLDRWRQVPYVFVTVATWSSFLQVMTLPLVYIIFHKPLRKAMAASANSYIRKEYPLQ